MRFIYVAGPLTQGDQMVNVRNAVLAGEELKKAGLLPYVPHLSAFAHFLAPHEYIDWISFDLEWLTRCDAVLRLPGASGGADGEVAEALRLGMPVYYSVEQLVAALAPGPVA